MIHFLISVGTGELTLFYLLFHVIICVCLAFIGTIILKLSGGGKYIRIFLPLLIAGLPVPVLLEIADTNDNFFDWLLKGYYLINLITLICSMSYERRRQTTDNV